MMQPRIVASLRSKMTKGFVQVVEIASQIVFTLFLIYIAAVMLLDPDKDTLRMPGAAFAISLGLASVTFSYSRTMKDGDKLRELVVFSGELFVYAAFMFMHTTVFKYGSLDLPKHIAKLLRHDVSTDGDLAFAYAGLTGFLNLFAFVFFLIGLIAFQRGLMRIGSIVFLRLGLEKENMDHSLFEASRFKRTLSELGSENGPRIPPEQPSVPPPPSPLSKA